jgi:epoxyqueuosine reductase
LVEALGHPVPLVRGHAAWALGEIGGETARAALEAALLSERDPEAAVEIKLAISNIPVQNQTTIGTQMNAGWRRED